MAGSIVGLDLGGSKSAAVLASEDGVVLGRFCGKGCGLAVDDALQPSFPLDELLRELLAAAGSSRGIHAVCANLGGKNVEQVTKTLSRRLPLAAITVFRESQAQIPLVLGGLHQAPAVLMAGTGSIAMGEHPRTGRRYVCGGWGMHLGDEGSGFWIGNRAIRAALRSWDGSGDPSVLAERILGSDVAFPGWTRQDELPARRDEVRERVRDLERLEVAALTVTVASCASQGDPVSQRILAAAGLELARLAGAVVRVLELADEDCAVLLAGGVFNAGAPVIDPLRRHLAEVAPRARPRVSHVGLEVAAAVQLLMESGNGYGSGPVRRLVAEAGAVSSAGTRTDR